METSVDPIRIGGSFFAAPPHCVSERHRRFPGLHHVKKGLFMKSSDTLHSPDPQGRGFSPWQQLKSKHISYLTLPLIVMATVVEFVILATGWKYQQVVCVPQGMGVIFFGIGPIGATILAVELLKLPLAIWTASRVGWQKGVMLVIGLPLICVLTFQLVKDMAVYEMGTAMVPASQALEKATAEEVKILQLNAELANQTKDDGAVKAVIQEKKADRDRKLSELAAKQARAKADIEESLKRNDATRTDAITLTDYQKKELAEAEIRQSTLIRQFDADAAQLTKAIAELRVRREAEVARATTWNVEEARIENAYKVKLAAYTNKKMAYDKDKTAYENANFVKRQLMSEPVHPGVPPERESNKVLKPTLLAEIEAQIKAKEAELIAVSTKRRDGVAQVGADARRLREDFDRRSGTKREETDRKREELLATMASLVKEGAAEAKLIEQEFTTATQKEEDTLKSQRPLEVVRAELDASRKTANGFYEEREGAIKKTQVHRIATTVEIVRGWLFGERPVSITASAKERGDLLTDQICMVRIWVYPVLAFIVAFLPTLMVEIGFSTLFKPERQRPAYRLGFFGRRLHWLYKRAGRQKILRAERLANEASSEIAWRDQALATAQAAAEQALSGKESELQATRKEFALAVAEHEEQLQNKEEQHEQESQRKEEEWVAKFSGMADSLNRAIIEKDSLRDLQKSEIERQIQMRQNAWSDRLTQLRKELDDQRAAAESERTTLIQEHHKKLMVVSEEAKTQVIQARRQMADAELAAVESSAKLAHDLKEALNARDTAESQLKHQADSLALRLSQAKEDGARELEKAARQEKHRLDRQQLEFEKTLRQREEDFGHRLQQREQDLTLAFESRLTEEKSKVEQEARRREAELESHLESRVRELDARWKQDVQQREEAAQTRITQREQQLQAQAEIRLRETQTQAEEQLRRREAELERQLEAKSREAESRLREELQQKELAFLAKLKQREQELIGRADARESELQNQRASDLRARDEEWERQAESRVRAAETRLSHEVQRKEELFQSLSRQRDQQWQVKLDGIRGELQAHHEQVLRRREMEADGALRDVENNLRKEMQQNDEAAQLKARQRELDLVAELNAQVTAQHTAAQQLWETESEKKTRAAIEPLKELLARTEKERDAAVSHMQDLEAKLTEASLFLNGWKNGKPLAAAA